MDSPCSSENENPADNVVSQHSYSAKKLKDLRESYYSRKWPKFLDKIYKNERGQWDPDRWHQNRTKSNQHASSLDEKNKSGMTDLKSSQTNLSVANGKPRRDAKERIKAEQDGIILSPQRRSFLSGCQVSNSSGDKENKAETNNETKKPSRGSTNFDEISLRPEKVGSSGLSQPRRIGSGRFPTRSNFDKGRTDFEFDSFKRNELSDERRPRDRSRERERKASDQPWGRNYDQDKFRKNVFGSNMRNDKFDKRHNRFSRRHEEEPEWMSETIEEGELMELHGFEESNDKNDKSTNNETERPISKSSQDMAQPLKKSENNHQQEQSNNLQPDDFNFDDFLQMGTIPGLEKILADDDSNQPPPEQSKFSKFFNRSKSPSKEQVAQTITPEENNIVSSFHKSLFKQHHGNNIHPNIDIPNLEHDSRYFAPISPAAQTVPADERGDNFLMNLIKTNNNQESANPYEYQRPSLNDLQGKNVKSVEELEANLRKSMSLGESQPRDNIQNLEEQRNLPENEMTAFKSFAALVKANESSKLPPGNIRQQMLNQQPNPNFPPRGENSNNFGGIIKPSPMSINSNQGPDSLMRQGVRPPMSQVPLNNARPVPQMDIFHEIYKSPLRIDLLKTPEAHSLQQAIEHGHATPLHLFQQFLHGDLSKSNRDILCNVLKILQSKGLIPIKSPVDQPPVYQTQPGPLGANNEAFENARRVSPSLNVQNQPPRSIPQSEEIYHTQALMQNAFVRQRMEEQKENYRRRNEGNIQRSHGQVENETRNETSSSQMALSFTPTAVMKKLAADRRDSDPRPQVQEMPINNGTKKKLIIESSELDVNRKPNDMQLPADNLKSISPNTLFSMGNKIMPPVPLPQSHPHPSMLYQDRERQQVSGMPPYQQTRGIFPNMVLPQDFAQNPLMAFQNEGNNSEGLSQFFSPELLAQAQSGNTPSMPPLPTQKAMTLEEIERQSASVNH